MAPQTVISSKPLCGGAVCWFRPVVLFLCSREDVLKVFVAVVEMLGLLKLLEVISILEPEGADGNFMWNVSLMWGRQPQSGEQVQLMASALRRFLCQCLKQRSQKSKIANTALNIYCVNNYRCSTVQ